MQRHTFFIEPKRKNFDTNSYAKTNHSNNYNKEQIQNSFHKDEDETFESYQVPLLGKVRYLYLKYDHGHASQKRSLVLLQYLAQIRFSIIMSIHQFHIPVMGIGFTLDSPIKVAKYGIDSVISLVQDDVIESARKHYSKEYDQPYTEIHKKEESSRARRITAYLNLVKYIVEKEFLELRKNEVELHKMVSLLPQNSPLIPHNGALSLEELLAIHDQMTPGAIDVNIMSKVDGVSSHGESDALASLRGFADSDLSSSLVISAGINPGLVTFMAQFPDFIATENAAAKKKIIIKVSDYRSAVIQGKMLAKKGIWPAEFRIESGLNCGGHAFATQGLLLGPILEEFKQNKTKLDQDVLDVYNRGLEELAISTNHIPPIVITAQGGIGNNAEHLFLLEHYQLNATGWGSPFLLVPEATTIDKPTMDQLAKAKENDIYLSNASPLGVKFNNLRNSSADVLRQNRIAESKPGSPCFKKHLSLNTEFGKTLCTASREYQKKKLAQLKDESASEEEYNKKASPILAKECICDGLATSFLQKVNDMKKDNNPAVSICPGPNIAYFSGTYSLKEMVSHIYGRINIADENRPNLFLKELYLYLDYFKENILPEFEEAKIKKRQVTGFLSNLQEGVNYYKDLFNTKLSLWEDKIKSITELDRITLILNTYLTDIESAS